MPMMEWTTYQQVCDGPDCYEEADAADSESCAERNAKEAGWIEQDGKWYCSKSCASRASRAAAKAAKEGR